MTADANEVDGTDGHCNIGVDADIEYDDSTGVTMKLSTRKRMI